MIASCDKGAKFSLKLSYGHVCCSWPILVRRAGREKHDSRYHPRHPYQMNAEEVPTGHAWMLTHFHMQSKVCVDRFRLSVDEILEALLVE